MLGINYSQKFGTILSQKIYFQVQNGMNHENFRLQKFGIIYGMVQTFYLDKN